MSKPRAQLRRADQRVAQAAAPLQAAVGNWMRRAAVSLFDAEFKRAMRQARKGVKKAAFQKATGKQLRDELRAILSSHALRRVGTAARRVGASRIPPQVVSDFMATKEVKLQAIMSSTRDAVRAGVRTVIQEALQEDPQPSAGEIARRIRTGFFGRAGGKPQATLPSASQRVLPTTLQSTDGGVLYAFSSERAALIAQTELVQAENLGLEAGINSAGMPYKEWIAHTDGRSGDRHHEEMNGVWVESDGTFVTPLGNEMRFPGDPGAPIKDVANCRCTVVGRTKKGPRRKYREG